MFISPLEHTIAALTPLECRICNAERNMLCLQCMPQLLSTEVSRCYLCNKLTSQHKVCRSCASKSALRRVWWLGEYKELLKELIFQMKYHRKRAFAREFGTHMDSLLPYLPEDTVVVPAPTASKRIRVRGYDQAVILAAQFAHRRGFVFRPVLARSSQADQIGKTRSERFRQMQSSFNLQDPDAIKGANILLLDDVLTTGATLEAAARLFRKSGAKHVDAAVIARHLPG